MFNSSVSLFHGFLLTRTFRPFLNPTNYSTDSIMRILNVAEKNEAAKNIAAYLSKGTARKREGYSKYNKIYEFELKLFGQDNLMIMTSVSGHLLTYNFTGVNLIWKKVDPISLFEAPVEKLCTSDNTNIKKTLEKEIRSCSKLIIWTDCDREGEDIGFEIIEVCKAVKPSIDIYRAKFSEITAKSVMRAVQNLEAPNKYLRDAVRVRQELDLRIGAAFTRFQTLYLQKAFPDALSESIVSYGSCQFPTLGFIVERFKAISEFIPEKFWEINVKHTIGDLIVEFNWERHRLFNKLACEVLHDKCIDVNLAIVTKVHTKPKMKWRPKPLDTVELEKIASKKLKINAKETLKIAEKLYTQGLISYPRTETNFFPKELNLVPLVECQTSSSSWGEFAKKLLNIGLDPFQGNKSDQAHPPIHPLKYTTSLSGSEEKIYNFIVRHFLACLSKHAEGLETTVEIEIANEKFAAHGLRITAENYLEVYPYDKWTDKEIHSYNEGENFKPEISMNEGETTPPQLLTEADLIALMEKHGIGTDSTHAEHIETIKLRLYAGLQNNQYFVPRTLGMGLVEAYNKMGYAMDRPELRADLEADLKRICNNEKSPNEVLAKHIRNYKKIFEGVQQKVNLLSNTIKTYIGVEAVPVESDRITEKDPVVKKCSNCKSDMVIRKSGNKIFLGCQGYPDCREAIWFSSIVEDVKVMQDSCNECGPDFHLVNFKFKRGSCYLPSDYISCLGGCDKNLLEILNCTRATQATQPLRSSTDGQKNEIDEGIASKGNDDSGFSSFRETSNSFIPNCNCGLPAARFTVKKSGPNFGRKFYKCDSSQDTFRCNFFKWEDESSTENGTKINGNISRENNDDEQLRCYCANPCRRYKVKKDGPNKGREFYGCGKPRGQNCNFFKWADEKNGCNAFDFNVDWRNSKKFNDSKR